MRLIHVISSLERGGAQAVLYELVVALQKKGYEQTVIYMHDGPYRAHFASHNITLYQLRGLLVPFDLLALYRFYRIIKKINPAGVHTVLWAANWLGRFASWMAAIPCIASLHNTYDHNGMMRNIFDRLLPVWNKTIIAVSEQVKQSFLHYQRAGCSITVIHNGINCDHQKVIGSKSINRRSLELSNDQIVIGAVGRFDSVKRYPLLLDTFAELYKTLPHVRLLIIGAGPDEEKIRMHAQVIAIDHLIIWIIDKPATDYYSIMDCFITTSRSEGISIALLEAMSFARPCLVTHAQGTHPVLQHMHNGLLVPTNNPQVIAHYLQMLVEDKRLQHKLGTNARRTVTDSFDSTRMIAAYDRLFKQLN